MAPSMTKARHEALQIKIFKMREISTSFYMNARLLEVPEFLEVQGLLNDRIDRYQRMLDSGIDFAPKAEVATTLTGVS